MNNEYPTASNVRCYIDGFHVDEIVRVEVKDQNAKVPLYSHNRAEFDAVANGKLLVTGSIVVNCRYPGYLYTLLKEVRKIRDTNPVLPTARKKNLAQAIQDIRAMNTDDLVRYLARADRGEFERSSAIVDAIEKVNAGEPDQRLLPLNIASPIEKIDPFSMQVNFLDPGSADVSNTTHGLAIFGIHLTGRSRVISNLSGGGDQGGSGQPIVEVYSFFARSISETLLKFEADE